MDATLDRGGLAREVSEITRRERRMLFRPTGEIERALREGRCSARFDDGRLVGFLFWHDYGRWAEIGTGYVAPSHRRRGLFTGMHDDVLRALAGRGKRAFGFPGDATVERVMRKRGFVRAGYAALPPVVWARFLADHYTPRKFASNLRALADGAHRTSLKLYVYPSDASSPA